MLAEEVAGWSRNPKHTAKYDLFSMISKSTLYKILTYLISSVWVVNGLFCKVLNLVPRHQQIVSRILGNEYASVLTKMIGILELIIAAWILTRINSPLNAVTQMLVVASMNVVEFLLASDLLLWGRVNSIFATLFILLIYYHEFILGKSIALER